MNIFVLDSDPEMCAQYHADKHVVKMILETAQLLSTAIRLTGGNYGYKATHKNHPSNIWARQTKQNFYWLQQLGISLLAEYTYRYNKKHKSASVILCASADTIPDGNLTPFAQAMPDEYKNNDAVQAYRNYYVGAKRKMLVYTRRKPPIWLSDFATYKPL